MKLPVVIASVCVILCIGSGWAKKGNSKSALEEVADVKEFKKLLKVRTSVLICYAKSSRDVQQLTKILSQVADTVKGTGTLALVDCSGEGKKICKQMKVKPEPYNLKHYKDGDFHKDYDRKETVSSMVNFMKDPSGDAPWEEDESAPDVVHIADPPALVKLLKKETKPVLIMFYAPWCGFCKRMKPDYSSAATELRGESVLAAIDVNRPENAAVRRVYNITGFPTLLYFQNGQVKYTYEGDNTKDAIVRYMRNPEQPAEKPQEPEWSEMESEVVHLTTADFDDYLKGESSVLVMFYAPWCGHCKRMKPDYMAAASKLKNGKLAAVDATKEPSLGTRFGVKGYPTLKYFKNGEFQFDVSVREEAQILDFMADPKEPPPPPPPEKPWSEEPSEVVHLNEENFKAILKKKKHALVMFYAPWCGHCKKAKPEYTAAAEQFKDDHKVVFAAVDCTLHNPVCKLYDVKGFPTFYYFNYLKESKLYQGGRSQSDFVSFMEDPDNPTHGAPPPSPSPLQEWAGLEGSQHLHHLTEANFDQFVKNHKSALIMFYAPWCGHCKSMKADYALAAKQLKEKNISGVLATVDATVQSGLQQRFEIRGFPTLRYFANGKNVAAFERRRKAEDIVDFMRNPPAEKKDEL